MNERDYVVPFVHHVTPAFVLEQHTPDDVARAMIEGGQQVQPFYIFNLDEAYRRVQHFKELMPRVKIFYGGYYCTIITLYRLHIRQEQV